MTGPQKKKKHHVGDTFYKRKYKTKHRARDIDEVNRNKNYEYTLIFQKFHSTRVIAVPSCTY